jgi:tripartite-type tricarboxylate transporter receptor subunit TctC
MVFAGTPKAIVDKLNAEINEVINRPDVRETWEKQGAVQMRAPRGAPPRYRFR